MKKRFPKSIWQLSFLFLFTTLVILIQGGWALWDYRSKGTYAWLDYDIFIDLFLFAIPSMAFICLMNIVFFAITSNRILSTATTAFVLMSSCLIIDMEIFIDRETAWDTYENVWNEGFRLAAQPILIIGLASIYPFYQLSRKISFCAEC
ncbi:hypothetical protein HNP37_004601 [Flavobacterium nitrogenifigens]|uniref:Uncharacterized protein n=2 Tax=Flavobacterium TaxID=237 RepID=A0A7W7J1F8_9FLAO|nr:MULTISPECIES: hypothetical protein [Flavobacterium]MBB4804509.1 hypothetical protein [Flavobacterium nitrogenifigens]MBB6389363.1 hypothetical protein [Flavobacterium notoginsengisoli]